MPAMTEWDYKVFWDEVIRQFKDELNTTAFSMWIGLMEYEKSSETSVVVAVPSQFAEDQIKQRYKKAIEKKFFELSGKNLILEFVVKQKKNEEAETKEAEKDAGAAKTQKNNTKKEPHPSLNAEYTFDNFVVGANNTFAANVAGVAAKNPGKSYSPVLIYGGVGLGKTHLMQAIGNQIWAETNLKLIYITAENFTNEFIDCLNKRAMPSFKNKYRKADILLIDDIHFFQGKPETQEELFHTFNELYEKKKQIVFTCDRSPAELKNLSQRLKSRFEMGINVDLQTPGYETRCAILFKKIERQKIQIPEDVLRMVAKNISSNVRDLEAALKKLLAYTELTKKAMNIEIAKDLLRDVFGSTRQRNISIDTIQKNVANYFNISLSDIKGKKRSKSYSFPRQIAMYLCREMTESSTTEIGAEFGGRDHTTILHGFGKIEKEIIADPSLETTIHELQKLIKEAINK